MRIGMYDKEIFIEGEHNCDVIRLVDKDTLEKLHTKEGLIEYGWDDLWKEAVRCGATTDGLDDWLDAVLDEEDNGDEMFAGKDDSFVNELTDEERAIADKYILDTYGIEVGTWEASGCYPPKGEYELILREE